MKARAPLLVVGTVIVAFVGCADDSTSSIATIESAPPEVTGKAAESEPVFDFAIDSVCDWFTVDEMNQIVADAQKQAGTEWPFADFDVGDCVPSEPYVGPIWNWSESAWSTGRTPPTPVGGSLNVGLVPVAWVPATYSREPAQDFDAHELLDESVTYGGLTYWGGWTENMIVDLRVDGHEDEVLRFTLSHSNNEYEGNAALESYDAHVALGFAVANAMLREMNWIDDSTGSTATTESRLPDSATATTESSPSVSNTATGQVPDVQQLVAMLVAEADLGSEWSVNPWGLPPTDRSSIGFGEGKFALQVCDDAPEDFRAAEGLLRWQAIVHLDMDTGGVYIEELLRADEPQATESLYATLEDGFDACMGSTDTDDAGRTVTREPMTVPEVGDERTGVLITIEDPGGENWILYGALVRDGPVLMYTQTGVAMHGDGFDPEFGAEQVEQMIRTMADKIA